jgi:hypothetical protein
MKPHTLTEGLEYVLQFSTARPYLAGMNTMDALAQRTGRLRTTEDTFGSASKGLDNQLPLARIQQHDDAALLLQTIEFSQSLETGKHTILQSCADDGYIGLELLNARNNLSRIDPGSNYSEAIVPLDRVSE